jgi:hypothetical protein
MDLQQIIKTDISGTTYRSVTERRKEFKNKIPNNQFVKKTSDSLIYKSRSTFNKRKYYDMIIKKKSNDLFIYCSCEAFSFQGFAYRANNLKCGIKKEKREDLFWKKFHGTKSILCKHLWILFNKDKKILEQKLKEI